MIPGTTIAPIEVDLLETSIEVDLPETSIEVDLIEVDLTEAAHVIHTTIHSIEMAIPTTTTTP